MTSNRSGFTLIEVLVAIVILALGLLSLAAGTGAVTRTLTGSRVATVAAQISAQKMDMLRAFSRQSAIPCTSANFTSSVGIIATPQGVNLTWSVPATGTLRKVLVIATYRVGGGRTRVDTLATNISCQ